MAFCPQCGKAVAEQATKCVNCSSELKPSGGGGGSGGSAKFKGTMIMSAPAVTPPKADEPATPPAPAAPAPAAPAPAAPPPAAAPAPATPPATGPGAFAKTMIGTGLDDDGSPVAGSEPAPAATEPAVPAPAEPKPDAPAPAAEAPSPETGEADGDGNFLPGDPMAPSAAAAPAPGARPMGDRPSPHMGRPAAEEKNKTWLWVGVGCLGMLAIGCIGTGAAVYLGLLSFGETMANVVQNAPTVGSLSAVHEACHGGDCSKADRFVHPQAADAIHAQVKKLKPEQIGSLLNPDLAHGEALDQTPDAKLAESLDLDPSSCTRITVGEAVIVGCADGETYRLIHLSNVESIPTPGQ